MFGGNREGISHESLDVLFGMLGQLDLGYRLLAFCALAFNIWAIWRGRPRWLGLVVLPPTLVAGSMLFGVQ